MPHPNDFIMGLQSIAVALIAVGFFLVRYLNRTDVPKIKNLTEIPGVPIFGSLIQLGEEHARVAAGWVKKYGAVFQVRLGNKVRKTNHLIIYLIFLLRILT